MQDNLVTVSNALNTAQYSLGVVDGKLILALISNINNDINCRKGVDNLEVISADKYYSINVLDYAKLYCISYKSAKEELKNSIQTLHNNKVTYVNEKGLKVSTYWISTVVEYDPTEHVISISWSKGIIPLISELRSRFTSYRLKHIRTLSSSYSIRWYMYLVMELDKCRKSSIKVELAVEDIRSMFVLGDKHTIFTHFMKRVIEEPINALNKDENCNINVQLTDENGKKLYKKVGKKVVSISFLVSRRK